MKLRITRNAVQCHQCEDVIESKHRHDFVTCTCGAVSVDGGHDYLKRAWATHSDHPLCSEMSEWAEILTKEEQAAKLPEIKPRIDEDGGWCDDGCPQGTEHTSFDLLCGIDGEYRFFRSGGIGDVHTCPIYIKRMTALLRRVIDEDGFHLGDQLKGDIHALLGGE